MFFFLPGPPMNRFSPDASLAVETTQVTYEKRGGNNFSLFRSCPFSLPLSVHLSSRLSFLISLLSSVFYILFSFLCLSPCSQFSSSPLIGSFLVYVCVYVCMCVCAYWSVRLLQPNCWATDEPPMNHAWTGSNKLFECMKPYICSPSLKLNVLHSL